MTAKARTKNGMAQLADVVLGLQAKGIAPSDIKRMVSAMSPEGAANIVNKHNEANPKSQWRLLKKDPSGPDTIDNMVDKNDDGIPDVIVVNKDDQPLIVNGYTTTKSKWADDLTYYGTFPTREARKAERLRHLDANNQPVKKYGRDDYIRDQIGVKYFTYEDVTRDELIPQIGTVVESHPERLPQFYRTPQRAPRPQSAYEMYKKNVFNSAFNDAVAPIEDVIRRNIPGKLKMLLYSKLCGATWQHLIKQKFDPENNLSPEELNKIKKRKAAKSQLDEMVKEEVYKFRHNTENHSYDNFVKYLEIVFNHH
ncbi:hypothetical protein M9Y10_030085 [Tritrichomonas musculus]|uniref:Uncharacterized protein n=1 Tax=Tritrichomonas musculus TaxID=1915356 RepID=A0ABR2KSB4_9EUKA